MEKGKAKRKMKWKEQEKEDEIIKKGGLRKKERKRGKKGEGKALKREK